MRLRDQKAAASLCTALPPRIPLPGPAAKAVASCLPACLLYAQLRTTLFRSTAPRHRESQTNERQLPERDGGGTKKRLQLSSTTCRNNASGEFAATTPFAGGVMSYISRGFFFSSRWSNTFRYGTLRPLSQTPRRGRSRQWNMSRLLFSCAKICLQFRHSRRKLHRAYSILHRFRLTGLMAFSTLVSVEYGTNRRSKPLVVACGVLQAMAPPENPCPCHPLQSPRPSRNPARQRAAENKDQVGERREGPSGRLGGPGDDLGGAGTIAPKTPDDTTTRTTHHGQHS